VAAGVAAQHRQYIIIIIMKRAEVARPAWSAGQRQRIFLGIITMET
jgi:hypothetical protein